jgi:hypothetical protein
MAGGAILGIIAAILRLTALGAPIRFIYIGEYFWLKHTMTGEAFLDSVTAEWYDGLPGQGISLLMFLGLAIACFWLAKKGAEWSLREEEEAEKEST